MKTNNPLTLTALYLWCSVGLTFSQSSLYVSPRSIVKHNFRDTVFTIDSDEQRIVHLKKDGGLSWKKFNPFESVKIIVEFNEEPFFLQTPGKVHTAEFYQSRFLSFTSDVHSLLSKASSARNKSIAQPEIRRNFYKTFFGVALEVPRIALNDILALQYVKKIHDDKMMKAYVNDTRRIVCADSVWKNFGSEGDSIVIGIIDTGIDYTHPALGGHFGPSYKVIGGYDCYNNDNDPFDDNGHGTHVAGIAAANSDTVKGIAPKAMLMAFKVLNASGYGGESTVIDGIERAADPNNDNNPNDKVDIANMSLGGSGTPDDAISTAVNNAVTLGIIFCVAAGNEISFKSIGSPAAAEKAITVGASDKSDKIAYFSSKGPTRKTFAMKPDVLAPGVDILSSIPGKKYEEKSGTSMASPVVAGICALLKSKNRTLAPAMAKSFLMSTAVSIDKEAMVQGAGRIDAFAAAKRTTYSSPAQLSFGLDSAQLPIWTRKDTIWITNNAQQSQMYTLSAPSLPGGVSITSVPQQVTVPAHESRMMELTLSVDNSVIPYPEKVSMTYEGIIYLGGTLDTLKLPWTFVKASIVLFTFNGTIADFIISNNSYSDYDVTIDYNNPGNYQAVVPKGVYDILVSYYTLNSQKIIIKEQVAIEAVTKLIFNPSEAKNRVTAKFVDPSGASIKSSNKILSLSFPDSSLFRSSSYVGNFIIDSMLFSSMSRRFTITYNEVFVNGSNNELYSPQFTLHGISTDTLVGNTPSDYRLVNVQADLPLDASSHTMTARIVVLSLIKMIDSYFGFGIASQAKVFTGTEFWNAKLYLMNSDRDAPNAALFEICRDGTPPYYFNSDLWMSSPPIRIINDSIVSSGHYILPPNTSVYTNGDIVSFSQSPVYSNGLVLNNYVSSSNIFVVPYFYGQSDESRSYLHSHLKIYNANDGVIFNDSLIKSIPIKVVPGFYRSVVSFSDYTVGNVPGNAMLLNSFDVRKEDPNPPIITSLKLLNARNKPVAGFSKNDSGWLSVSSVDFFMTHSEINIPYLVFSSIMKDSTRFLYKQNGTTIWKELPATEIFNSLTGSPPIGALYRVDLSATTVNDSTAIDILTRFVDQSGNVTEWILSSAYTIGNYKAPLGVNSELHNGNTPETFVLYQNFPNPFNPDTKIMYDVPKQGNVSITIYDVLGRTVRTLIEQDHVPGRYSVLWNGKSTNGLTVSSGIYFYRFETNGFVQTRKMTFTK